MEEYQASLMDIYGPRAATQRARYALLRSGFERVYGSPSQFIFRAPGRVEIGGNHTDHQCGIAFTAAVEADTIAAVAYNGEDVVHIQSEGYPMCTIRLTELEKREREMGTTPALVRGMLAAFARSGADYTQGGFDAYVLSDVPSGGGLSSSAAYEVLIGVILNVLYSPRSGLLATPLGIAKFGRAVENIYFGKPCGLLDQLASSLGGLVAVDFAQNDRPVVKRISFDLEKNGYRLAMLRCGGHSHLTAEYAAIPDECGQVARYFGKKVLREVSPEQFYADIAGARKACGDRAVLRAHHFMQESPRAMEEAQALERGDIRQFLQLVRESGRSSALYLQNVIPRGAIRRQDMMMTLAMAEAALGDRGAARVHGGGFGGTCEVFVPLDIWEDFKAAMEGVFGKGVCFDLQICPKGGCQVLL